MKFPWYKIVELSIFCTALPVHCLGLLSIFLYKKKTNQNLILTALSLAEMTYCAASIERIVKLSDPQTAVAFKYINNISAYMLLVMMYVLTLDRLVCVVDTLKYKDRVSRRRIFISIGIALLVSVVMGTLWKQKLLPKIVHNVAVSAYLVLVGITYSLVVYKVTQSRRQLQARRTDKQIFRKEFMMPGLIILTFIVSYTLPTYMFNETKLPRYIFKLLMATGLLTDPLLYIFLTKNYRQALVAMAKTRLSERNNQQSGTTPTRRTKTGSNPVDPPQIVQGE